MREGADPTAMRKGVGATPHARRLLAKFVHRARGPY
jgi:hypothetical protein